MVKADLDSPCRELSNGGLKSVVTLLVRWQIVFLSARIRRPIQLYLIFSTGVCLSGYPHFFVLLLPFLSLIISSIASVVSVKCVNTNLCR